ncbi:hypothetical protein AB0K60_29210 [Thermopolyspora sp. NPDC052614]|uniref:Cas10/Cmr2 second palm domain-containing protein n=1 Tax=Thermopolyspora sp. NPDC052614 TaxID=3155682 RepID=UPI0034441794
MNVVVIRTAGNQRYIFSSNKRQEIVGASELISRVDRVWVHEALREAFTGYREEWRIDGGHPAELLMAGAGGITVQARDAAAARKLVTHLTRKALEKAPGLDVCGVVIGYGADANAGSGSTTLADAIYDAQAKLAVVREGRPGPQARFGRLPLVEECASNGLPAYELVREGDEPAQPRSKVAVSKLDAFRSAFERLADLAPIAEASSEAGAKGDQEEVDRRKRRVMGQIVDRLGLEADWVAVVHADGNALGDFFKRLRKRAKGQSDAAYAKQLRDVSKAVDDCAKAAFRAAWRNTRNEFVRNDPEVLVSGEPPVLPLVLGGDDLTVVCEGRVALTFTRHFLEEFEKETAKGGWTKAGDRDHLTAAAGVAIVKRNYPFHFAYELAEELLEQEAKAVKELGSAVAFAVLLDSAAADLKRLRRSFSGKSSSPYLVGKAAQGDIAGVQRWEDLERRVAALNAPDPEGEGLLVPRSVAHDLREGLSLGPEVAASRLRVLQRRYAEGTRHRNALDRLAKDPDSLGGLPDAMAAVPFLPQVKAWADAEPQADVKRRADAEPRTDTKARGER